MATAGRRARLALALLAAAALLAATPAGAVLVTTNGCACDAPCAFLGETEELPGASFVGDTSHGAFCYINVNDAVASGCDPYVDISQDALDLGLAGWDYCGYSWHNDPDDYCWTYSDQDGWATCWTRWTYSDPQVSSFDSVYCYDLNDQYSSDGYMVDAYCGTPGATTDYSNTAGYWFSLKDTCTQDVCGSAPPTPSVTSTDWYSYYTEMYGSGYSGGSSDGGNGGFTQQVSSSEWATYVPTPLAAGISFPWTKPTSWGCTCTGACQSGPLTSYETVPRDFTWCLVEPYCGPGDAWDYDGIVDYDICGYALNLTGLDADKDFFDCYATDITTCTSPQATVAGSSQPMPWKIECTDSAGDVAPHPGWYDCYTGYTSESDMNYFSDLMDASSATCTYTCSWWDAAQYGGYSGGGWPPTPAAAPPPPAPFLTFSTLSSTGPVNVSDVIVLVGYSEPDSRGGASTAQLGPDNQLSVRNALATAMSAFNITAKNITLSSFRDVAPAALAGRRLLQGNAAVAISFIVTASSLQAAGDVSSSLQAFNDDTYTFMQQLVAVGLDKLQGIAFPLQPVMQDASGTCMAFTPSVMQSPPPYYYSSDSSSSGGYNYYGGGYSSSTTDWASMYGMPSAPTSPGGTPPPPPSFSRPPMPPPPAPPPPISYVAQPEQLVRTYNDLVKALKAVALKRSTTIVILRDIYVTSKEGVSAKADAAFSLKAMANITILGNTSSCMSFRNDRSTGPCVLDAGNTSRIFALRRAAQAQKRTRRI